MSGIVRVGRITFTSDYKQIKPEMKGFKTILCLSKSSTYGSLGPYVLKTKENHIFENEWQFRKVYPKVNETKQSLSRWQRNVIAWEHPSETHIDISTGKPNELYFKWRKKGLENKYPVRYPPGFGRMKDCLYFLQEDDPSGEKLDYISARKKFYLPVYTRLVQNEPQFLELKDRLKRGENLLILEVDGPHQESLDYYRKKYSVKPNFIINSTMICSEENLRIMLNDPKHPFGHGYCLAAALQDLDIVSEKNKDKDEEKEKKKEKETREEREDEDEESLDLSFLTDENTKRKDDFLSSSRNNNNNDNEPIPVEKFITKKTKLELKKNEADFFCKICSKKLDIKHEIENNIKRLNAYALFREVECELVESMKEGSYACEMCLRNE